MHSRYLTPVYSSLYKKMYIFAVSPKFFAAEIAIAGIITFVIKAYALLALLLIVHIFVAIINKKEPMWKDIFKFLIRIPDEKYAKLD